MHGQSVGAKALGKVATVGVNVLDEHSGRAAIVSVSAGVCFGGHWRVSVVGVLTLLPFLFCLGTGIEVAKTGKGFRSCVR